MYLNDRILAVDDDTANLTMLEELLGLEHTVMSVATGNEALHVAPAFRPDLILLDVKMPRLDGVETCHRLRALPELAGTRIVMLSALNDMPRCLAACEGGASDCIAKPFDRIEVLAKVRTWMQMVHKECIEEMWHEAEIAREAVGDSLLSLSMFRNTESGDHLFRVRWYAQTLADQLAAAGPYRNFVNQDFREGLYLASPLHDIGNVAVADAILRKPGPLTTLEFESMKKHTIVGSEVLRVAAQRRPAARYLEMAADIARHHHERFDGTGYPDRIAGTIIPLAARIVAVADVFDALTTKRVYKDAVAMEEAMRIIVAGAATQFDPAIVEGFQARWDDVLLAQPRFAAHFAAGGSASAATPAAALSSCHVVCPTAVQ